MGGYFIVLFLSVCNTLNRYFGVIFKLLLNLDFLLVLEKNYYMYNTDYI